MVDINLLRLKRLKEALIDRSRVRERCKELERERDEALRWWKREQKIAETRRLGLCDLMDERKHLRAALEQIANHEVMPPDIVPFARAALEGGEVMKQSVRGHGPWRLRLICCGLEVGYEQFETWEEADRFRESYCSVAGHDRAAILEASGGEEVSEAK